MEFIKILMRKKAIIISIKGTTLTKKEELLLSREKPWGIILFKRNIKSFEQIKSLIKDIKRLMKDSKFPILIDEEGSTVSRLKGIINHDFEANYFVRLYKLDKKIKQSYQPLVKRTKIEFEAIDTGTNYLTSKYNHDQIQTQEIQIGD